MDNHLLVVSSDNAWLSATQMLLSESKGNDETHGLGTFRVMPCKDAKTAVGELNNGVMISAAIISGFHLGDKTSFEQAGLGYGARDLCDSLRKDNKSLPILIDAPVRLDLLEVYASGTPGVTILPELSLKAVWRALNRIHAPATSDRPENHPWAQIDVLIDIESFTIRTTLPGGYYLGDSRMPTNMGHWLKEAQEEMEEWELYEHAADGSVHVSTHLLRRLLRHGEKFYGHLQSVQLQTAVDTCLKSVGSMDKIHFRFGAANDNYRNVPFEALWDCQRREFVRRLSPLARRVLIDESRSIALPDITTDASWCLSSESGRKLRVLVIASPAQGRLNMRNGESDGHSPISFSPPPTLEDEVTCIRNAWSEAGCPPTEVWLTADGDGLGTIASAIGTGPWDIVHFCGHGIRVQDKDVFLVLPGKGFALEGLAMTDFSRLMHEGRVTLLVLSSCQGASSLGLFRLAQQGVPATIGFRWEVDAEDALKFSGSLHTKLAGGKSLGRAYLEAVRDLKSDPGERSLAAFYSVMLLVQPEAWARADLQVESEPCLKCSLTQ